MFDGLALHFIAFSEVIKQADLGQESGRVPVVEVAFANPRRVEPFFERH